MQKIINTDLIINDIARRIYTSYPVVRGKKYIIKSSDNLLTSSTVNDEPYIDPIKMKLSKYPLGNIQIIIKKVHNVYANYNNTSTDFKKISDEFNNKSVDLTIPSALINIDLINDMSKIDNLIPIPDELNPIDYYYYIGRKEILIKINRSANIIEYIMSGRFHDMYLSTYNQNIYFEKISDACTDNIIYLKCYMFKKLTYDHNIDDAITNFKIWLNLNDVDLYNDNNYYWTNKYLEIDSDTRAQTSL
jgi:hypothetical protein